VIVCANISGLVLVRGISRRGEIALRLALDASRTRILRLLLIENLVLAALGAAAGHLLLWYALPLTGSRAAKRTRAAVFRHVRGLAGDRFNGRPTAFPSGR
jgi:ABC-type antimicrobial peptide transport system permease subunit